MRKKTHEGRGSSHRRRADGDMTDQAFLVHGGNMQVATGRDVARVDVVRWWSSEPLTNPIWSIGRARSCHDFSSKGE
jgi:hypothetical protein